MYINLPMKKFPSSLVLLCVCISCEVKENVTMDRGRGHVDRGEVG